MEINCVIVDFGGVLYYTPTSLGLKKWLKVLGLDSDNLIKQLLNNPEESEIFWSIMKGEMSEEVFWDSLSYRWKVPKFLLSFFKNRMMSRKRLNNELISYFSTLKGKYKLGILSNAGSNTRRIFEKTFNFQEVFDEMIISAEEKFAKPEKELFFIALDRLGTKPKLSVFIDDLPVNIQAAKDLGLNTILHSNNINTLNQLQTLLR